MHMDRREFLKASAGAAASAWLVAGPALWALEAVPELDNPLGHYPERGWEALYRDQYRYDRSFSWVCSPNDTHACRVLAFVKNGVITRLGAEYDYQKYSDLYGNHATANWNPRQCAKGYTFHRRVYGPYRLKHPLIRRGWKQWADDGFPELTGENRTKYKFDARGSDVLEKCTWPDAYRYIARALAAIARRYSGPEGAARLRAQGYPEEMIEAAHGAGTRCLKFRGGMGLLGVIGKYGMYRLANSMALLDQG
ncbi:MAG: twin-arginine translocation signal domain-containing protein, partial [Planctomycetes bacterium]|nr:twin-arginine translocation signal domain-containing protein [Planctomycetota bacterium]